MNADEKDFLNAERKNQRLFCLRLRRAQVQASVVKTGFHTF